jgi:hypothetical protein
MGGHYASCHKIKYFMKCEIWRFRGGTDDGSNLLRCDAMYTVKQLQDFRRSLLPPSSCCINSCSWARHRVNGLTITDVS